MVKYEGQLADLISRLSRREEIQPISRCSYEFIRCQACCCAPEKHKNYVYCGLIGGFVCRICCSYDLYNNYQLVNELLEQDLFKSPAEVRLICDKYCPVEWANN